MTTKTTPPLDVAAIRARADAATPGPWFFNSYSTVQAQSMLAAYEAAETDEECYAADPDVCSVPAYVGDTAGGRHVDDAAFISNARADVPELCDALEAALAEVALLRAVIDALPRCACGQPATRALHYDIGQRECDKCGPTGIFADLPHAAALRALLAGGER